MLYAIIYPCMLHENLMRTTLSRKYFVMKCHNSQCNIEHVVNTAYELITCNVTGELDGRSEPGTLRIRRGSANQSSTRFDKRLVDFISTILSHFTQHIISTFMWIPPASLYIHIIRNFLTKRTVVTALRHEMYGGEQIDSGLRSAGRLSPQPISSAVVLYLQSSPDRKREWAQTRIWRSRKGWTHTHTKKVWQDRQNGICTPHQLLLLFLLLSSSWSSSKAETGGNTING